MSARPVLRLLRMAGPLRGRLVLAACAGALATGCGVALLAASGFLLARASEHPGITAVSVAVVVVRGLSIGRGAFRYAERLASHDVALRVLGRARVAIWRRLEVLAPAGLPAFRSADLLTRLVSDVDATQDLFIRGLTPPLAAMLAGSGAVLACTALLAPAGPLLATGLLAGGLAVPLCGLIAAGTATRRAALARGRFSSAVGDILAGSADLLASGAAEVAIGRAQEANHDLTTTARRSAIASGTGSGLAALAAGLTLWGVLLLGVEAAGSGSLSRVSLAVLALTALAAFEAVTVLPPAALALSQSRASARRISQVLDAPAPIIEPRSPRPLPTGPVTISLREARARYAPDGPLAIDGVSLDLWPGRRVALVGPNGAGKSTVASILLRFRDLAGGTVTLNGHDLADFAADEVRTLIGGCPQDTHLFDASIADNLRIARPEATDDELGLALAKVGLLGWASTLPLGTGTQVGADGAAVSGGQRQRIALARTLLANAAIVILDEPAAHLDPAARRALTADLLAATSGRATLLITHDIDGLDQVDEIIVLDHGVVADRGSHAQLLAAGGPYARTWQRSGGVIQWTEPDPGSKVGA